MDGGEELTAQQTALYDRQIRVWGVDAQKKLSKAHILVNGLNGTAAEAISGKGDPLKNFFYFDVADGKGVIEDISTPCPDTNSTNGQNRISDESTLSLYVVP